MPADNGTFFQRYLLPSLALLDHYLCLPFNDWPAKWDNRVKDRLAGGKVALAQVKEKTADVGPSQPQANAGLMAPISCRLLWNLKRTGARRSLKQVRCVQKIRKKFPD
jgi:hypothetical protein